VHSPLPGAAPRGYRARVGQPHSRRPIARRSPGRWPRRAPDPVRPGRRRRGDWHPAAPQVRPVSAVLPGMRERRWRRILAQRSYMTGTAVRCDGDLVRSLW